MKQIIETHLHRTGVRSSKTSFHIWIYAVAAEALKENFDAEKHEKILNEARGFAAGNWMKYNGTEREREDLEKVIRALEAMA